MTRFLLPRSHPRPSPITCDSRFRVRWAVCPLLSAAVLLLCAAPLFAQIPPAGTVRRPAAAPRGPVVVPDRFLRSWDPVTVFFERDLGGAPGTPEDRPQRFVTLDPPHPGAFTWLDAHTLQFRPADAWTPLTRYRWRVGGHETVLASLMPAPLETLPAADATGLDPVETITLVFPEPVEPAALAQMVTIELRPLPGIGGGGGARWLTSDDFTVAARERATAAAPAGYVLWLASPIPLGTRAVVHLRLALEDDDQRSFASVAFTTAEPFRVVAVGTRRLRYPVTVGGSRYAAEQAIDGGSERLVVVELSASPAGAGPVEARQLVRISPAVEGLEYSFAGDRLEVEGEFRWDTVYTVAIHPAPLHDVAGRTLEATGVSEMPVFFPRRPPFLRLTRGSGLVERFGPKMVPVEGRGHDRFDLRVVPVDPLDRGLWPFPDGPVTVDEAARPPGPGEVPGAFTATRHVRQSEIASQLAALGSPAVSELVELPLAADGGAATFGLDLGAELAKIGGADRPGHYLVGLRPLGAGSQRQWMRLQVSDLSLTAVEEAGAARLLVTSLASAKPVAGAEIRIEGMVRDRSSRSERWITFAGGVTDGDGAWRVAPFETGTGGSVLRITVRAGGDVLVLDPTRAPDGFADGSWFESGETWLDWLTGPVAWRGEQPAPVVHLFSERPVYRPEEPVHLKGYLRLRRQGGLELCRVDPDRSFVVVRGPGELEWRYPVEVTEDGSFHHSFLEPDRPTGVYRASFEGGMGACATVSDDITFRLEAYRIPRFQIDLHAPDRASLDRPFEVGLTATYYAGGRVADRPLEWRVTQFPYSWQPPGLDGFMLSSDARFSGGRPFEASAALEREDRTDDAGAARLELDPTAEPTAQPRIYVVEATMTGADDQTVTATRRVTALPPFVLGLKVPRFLAAGAPLTPQVVALDGDGALRPGVEISVRLLQRQWHSWLQASDFSDGEARWVTDVVDDEVLARTVTSGDAAVAVPLPVTEAGVYLVELSAQDAVGRAQTVTVDLFAGGDEPVTWAKPAGRVLEVQSDSDRYWPGETATLVVESPFQTARVLAVVEAPAGNRYSWLEVRGGQASFTLPIEPAMAPRVPVHFVLLRGRVKGTAPLPGATTDLGKPATLAATAWLEVEPRANQLALTLEHPATALPGEEVPVTIRLADPDGRPLAGEVTLWLVDGAVLALGREQRLDPLPDLVLPVSSHLVVRDTRELPFGELPFTLNPGGGEANGQGGLLDRATVRRNFQPVPFYEPRILIGGDGETTVTVALPDNLTVFKLRAKAVSGAQRFGFATGELAVRLPLIVQPALPRFVRPGDRFTGAAIGRVVEGEGGPGSAAIEVAGAELLGEATREVGWVPNLPRRIDFEVAVPTPDAATGWQPAVPEAVFRVAVERASDGVRDAFEVRLPVLDDRNPVTRRVLVDLVPGESVALPAVEGTPRPGSVRRTVLASSRPAVVRMAAGLSFLLRYPHGCTEQRLSRARAWIGLDRFREALALQGGEDAMRRMVDDTLAFIPQVVGDDDLVAYWPGSRGYVSLTAWTVQLLTEARDAGYMVDEALYKRLLASLARGLRSDDRRLIDGAAFSERCWALLALTRAGRFDPAYAAELARRAQYLDLESTAAVLRSFVAAGAGPSEAVDELVARMWDGLVVRLYQGREVYGGLQADGADRSALILPSETRALAEVTRAVAAADPGAARLPVLVDGLVRLGRDDGWGSTNADAAALLALAEVLAAPDPELGAQHLEVRLADGAVRALELDAARPSARLALAEPGPAEAVLVAAANDTRTLALRAETSWVPAERGSEVAAESRGFVVTREQLAIAAEAGVPPTRLAFDVAGRTAEYRVGQVVEERVELVNPADRHFVALVVPLAAGLEPLNPALATAPPEAAPSEALTRPPAYAQYLDDRVAFYYDELPKGTYRFAFRSRATVAGTYIQPPAVAEMMYDGAVRGAGNGATVVIEAREE